MTEPRNSGPCVSCGESPYTVEHVMGYCRYVRPSMSTQDSAPRPRRRIHRFADLAAFAVLTPLMITVVMLSSVAAVVANHTQKLENENDDKK